MAIAKFQMVGRLTRDAEVKHLPSGDPMCQFSLAVDDGWGDKKHTSFYDCVKFGKGVDALAKHLTRGKQLMVEGNLKHEQWEKEGVKRSKVSFNVQTLEFGADPRGGQRSEPKREDPGVPEDDGFDDEPPF
jgi:single-strand DNA-binding protein